jgi:mono/diheme cytochrome c family protein
MARKVAWGTPGKAEHFLKPRSTRALMLASLGLGAALGALYLVLGAVGFRGPIAPGSVTFPHAPVEPRCQECHAPRVGASNLRCQRCHDPSSADRLSHSAHVLFGSRDVKKAAAAPDLACARCHVEHRGRAARLAQVDQAQCLACHFPSFASHPEFAALRTPTRETPGLTFPHERHVKEFVKRGVPAAESCVKCHEPQNRDLARVEFDRHCAECHAQKGSVGIVEPLPLDDALPAGSPSEGFDVVGGQVSKGVVAHRDDWVRGSLTRLRQDLDPAGYAAERGTLLARLGQLRRRLAVANPLAALDLEGLKQREAALVGEGAAPAAVPGDETDLEMLARLRDRRQAELARVRDEIDLRRAGAAPPRTAAAAGQQRATETEIRALEVRLLELPDAPTRVLSAEERARKQESAEILATSCQKCHQIQGATIAPVALARRALVRARFQHQPHLLQAECLHCHQGIDSSRKAEDLSVPGVQSCRECHKPQGAPQTCQSCHQFHPPELP